MEKSSEEGPLQYAKQYKYHRASTKDITGDACTYGRISKETLKQKYSIDVISPSFSAALSREPYPNIVHEELLCIIRVYNETEIPLFIDSISTLNGNNEIPVAECRSHAWIHSLVVVLLFVCLEILTGNVLLRTCTMINGP